MTIIDLAQDVHKELMICLNKANIKFKIVWQTGLEYCIDFEEHDEYIKAKKCQISLEKRFTGVPYVA